MSAIVAAVFLGGLATLSAAAEEDHKPNPAPFYGTVISYSPGDAIVARARRVGAAGGGVETFHLTPQTTLNDRVPQVDDGVSIQWQGTIATGLIALKIYARAGGLPDQSTPASASPTAGVVAHATPAPTQPAARHGFYGTVTSFTAPVDSKPGALTARALDTGSNAGSVETFTVTSHTIFRDADAPQVGDGVGVAWEGSAPDGLVATVVYVRAGGFANGVVGRQPSPSGAEPGAAVPDLKLPPGTDTSTEQPSSVETASPVSGISSQDDSGSAPSIETVAGMLVAYIAPLDTEDGLLELGIPRPGAGGGQRVESFLIPVGTQIDVGSTDGSTAVGAPVALSWVARGGQRVAVSVAIS